MYQGKQLGANETVFEDGRQAEFYCLVTEITKKESDKGDSYQLCVKTGGEKTAAVLLSRAEKLSVSDRLYH